jgi:hypothetical protein
MWSPTTPKLCTCDDDDDDVNGYNWQVVGRLLHRHDAGQRTGYDGGAAAKNGFSVNERMPLERRLGWGMKGTRPRGRAPRACVSSSTRCVCGARAFSLLCQPSLTLVGCFFSRMNESQTTVRGDRHPNGNAQHHHREHAPRRAKPMIYDLAFVTQQTFAVVSGA